MKIYKYKPGIIILLVLSPWLTVFSQQANAPNVVPRIEYQGYLGRVLKHRASMKDMGNAPYTANELRLGFATTGTKFWHQQHRYPVLGLGIYTGNFNNPIIGKPRAFFGFMEIPIKRNPEHYFVTNWSLGAVFNLNEYDSITNPKNVAIGSDMNAYIEFSSIYKFKITDRVEMGTGIKFQHFSNGAYKLPNLGVNMAAASLTFSYLPAKTITDYKKIEEPESYKKYEVVAMYAGSYRAKNIEESKKYYNSTISVGVNRRINQRRTLGVGFDYFYQPYLIDYYQDKSLVTDKELMSYAGFLSSDLIVNRIRISVQFGLYLHRPVDFGKPYYERVGFRFYATKNIFANFSIKAHYFKAEFMEWGLGFNF